VGGGSCDVLLPVKRRAKLVVEFARLKMPPIVASVKFTFSAVVVAFGRALAGMGSVYRLPYGLNTCKTRRARSVRKSHPR